jgi:hypothetical protein
MTERKQKAVGRIAARKRQGTLPGILIFLGSTAERNLNRKSGLLGYNAM